MTKAEERRAYLQAQSATQPQINIQPTQTMTRADQRRLELQQAQQPVAQPVVQQPTPQITQPVQPAPVVTQPQVAQTPAQQTTSMADKLRSGARLTPEETIQAAVEMGRISPEEGQKRLNGLSTPTLNTQNKTIENATKNTIAKQNESNKWTINDDIAEFGDTLKTIGKGTVVFGGRALDAINTAKNAVELNDTSAIPANYLLDYANGKRDVASSMAFVKLKNIAENSDRADDLDLKFLYNAIKEGKYAGNENDIKNILNKSQAYYHDKAYRLLVQPSLEKYEQQKQENIEKYPGIASDIMNTGSDILSHGIPTVLGMAVNPTAGLALSGGVTGETKMQQYLENGKDYSEAAKNVPIEAAKGVAFGKILEVASPVLNAGIKPDMSTLARAGRAFVNGFLVGGGASLATQSFDLLKEDPNYDFIDWNKVENGIKTGTYNSLEDYLNSDEYIKDVAGSRAKQLGISALMTAAFNTAGQVKQGIKANQAAKATQASNEAKADEYLKTLGLKRGATEEQVRKAARQLSAQFHPDRNPGFEEQFNQVRTAYAELSKPEFAFVYGKGVAPTTVAATQRPVNTANAVASDQALVPYAGQAVVNTSNIGNMATQQATNIVKPTIMQQPIPTEQQDVKINQPEQPSINVPIEKKIIKDNQGRQLTKQQQNFYKEASPKARDSQGQLLNLYHTTPAEFNMFDNSKLGENTGYNNTAFGIFVTPNKAFSSRFGDIDNEGKNYRTLELYTNAKRIITHPFNAHDKYQGEELDNIVLEYIDATAGEIGLKALNETLAELREYDPEATYYDAYETLVADDGAFENAEEERKQLEAKGYDGVEFVEGLERDLIEGNTGKEPVVSFALFNGNNLKSATNTNPQNTPDINDLFPSTDELKQFISDQNKAEINSVAKDAKTLNLEMPNQNIETTVPTGPTQKVRKHIDTIANAPSTPKEVAKDIRNDERKYYIPQTNEETMDNAKAIIGNDYDKAERAFLQRESLETAEDVAVADLLIQKAVSVGDYKKADELAIALSQKYTKAGQVLQAANIIKHLSPSGMLVYAEKELDNATRTIKKENPNLYKKLKEQGIISKNDSGVEKIQLTDNEKKQIVDNMSKLEELTDQRQKDILVGKTMRLIADKIPANALEKVASLRRNGLLTNLKTLNRNLGSNSTFGLLENIKDIPAALIDSVTSLVTGERTMKLPNLIAGAKGFGKGLKEAIQDLYYGIDTTDGTEGKYGLHKKAFKRENWGSIAKAFKQKQGLEGVKKVFGRILSDYEDTAGFLVNGTDRPFWQARFESELANQMKLGGLKYGEDIPSDDMLEIAKESADYATFKNKNALSTSLSGLRKFLNNGKPIGAADALGLTFTNVPGSVGTKISDYTVGGYAKAIKEIYNAATKNGKFNQRKFVDYLGRAVTGTGLVGLLIPLIAKGILTGNYDDDKDKADIEREMGIQQNAINLSALKRFVEGKDTSLQEGDKFYNFDWLQPVAGLAIMGANYYKVATQGQDSDEEGIVSNLEDETEYYVKKKAASAGDIAAEMAKTIGNQVADMSSLGNFADLFRGYEGLGGNLIDIPGNFASSFIPTLSNNIGQYSDETARNTKDYTSRWQTNINKILNKIPGVRETLTPKVNTMGEEKKQYVDGNDFISTFINPGYMTTYSPTDVQKELQAVYQETGDKTIYPSVAQGTITSKNETVRLKPKGVETYQKASGQYAAGIYDALLDNDFYKSLEADKKATILKKIADDSRDVGKAAIGIETDNYFKLDTNREVLEKNGIPLVDYYLLYKPSTSKGKKTGFAQTVDSINEIQGKNYISSADKAILRDIFGIK